MNQPSADVQQRLNATRQAIAVGLEAVDAVREYAPAKLDLTDGINLTEVKCSLSGSSIARLNSRLMSAATAGHRITATAAQSSSEFVISWRPEGQPAAVINGEPGELVAHRAIDDFSRAVSSGNAVAALAHLSSQALDLVIDIRAPADGASWVRTLDLLRDELSGNRWASTLIKLTPQHDDVRNALVLVQDAGSAMLLAPGLTLVGPEGTLPAALPSRLGHLTRAYRTRAGYRPRPDMLTPTELNCTALADGVFAPLAEALASASRAAAWYWVADAVSFDSDRVLAHFEGVSSLELELAPYGVGEATAEVALTEWATATGEPSRADAVQQAVTFAVRAPADLASAAGPVLRTARSLHELSGRGLVAEALATRRAARDSAVTAASSAAATARDVATKTVERTLVLLVAAAVALFANGQQFIETGTSYAIISVLAVLAAAALVIVWIVDTRSGIGVLDAFNTDVELYRDTLSEDDIRATRGLAALSKARKDLRRARITASIVYGGVIVGVLCGGSVIIDSHQTIERKFPTSSPSTETESSTPTPIESDAQRP